MTGFASNVVTRTCTTPTASESTIYLGHHQQGDIQSMAAGTMFAQRDFTFTFVCPRKRYDSISFLVEPMHGIEPAYPRTMKIAQGSGMAQGVGVRLSVQMPDTHLDAFWQSPLIYRDVVYRTAPLSNAGGYLYGSGKYPLFQSIPELENSSPDDTNAREQTYYLTNDESPTIQRVVNFRARLIRLPETVQPGQIKAAALIHIRYN